MIQYFDSHAHLSSPEVLPQIEEVLARARAAGVSRMLNICTDVETLEQGLKLAEAHPEILNAGATTPHDVESEGELAFAAFEKAALAGRLAAVGETGLDYHYEHSPKEKQKAFLIRYLHLAAKCRRPAIFHCREAFSDLFEIADAEYPKGAPAILHCFTGTLQEAREVVKRGWHVSFSGIVTFKKSEALRDAAKWVPLSQLLIETDTPYLAPESRRGRQNEPAFLPETARAIAAVRGISLEELADASFANAGFLLLK